MPRRNRDAGLPGHPTKFAPNVRDTSGCPLDPVRTLTPTDRRYRSVLIDADAPNHELLKAELTAESIKATEGRDLDGEVGSTVTILHQNLDTGTVDVIEGKLGKSLGVHRLVPKSERGRAIALELHDCLAVLNGYGRSAELVETYEKHESRLPHLAEVDPDVWEYIPIWDGSSEQPGASAAFVLAGRRRPAIFVATDMSEASDARGHIVYGYEFTPGSPSIKTMAYSSDLEQGAQVHALESGLDADTLNDIPPNADDAYKVLFGSSPHLDQ